MDLQSLTLHLKSLDESSLRGLYNDLYEICTGRRLETAAELTREIAIVETTDVERGWLHHELLGKAENLRDEWLPNSAGSNIGLNARIRYESNGELNTPHFQREHRIFAPNVIYEEDAEKEIQSIQSDPSSSIAIIANFPNWPSGWSVWSQPPISPSDSITDQKLQSIDCHYWILICRNYKAANHLLTMNLDRAPILAIIDEPEDNDPTHAGDIRVVARSEAPELIREFCERSEIMALPDKPRIVQSIKKMYGAAAEVVTQAKSEQKRQRHLHLKLMLAKNAWEKMFIDERDAAIKALQIETVAHPMKKTLLIMRGEREGYVHGYMKERLIPLVKNFISRECLLLELHHLEQQAKLPLPQANDVNEMASELRAGFLYALPSIGLLIPNIPISLTTLSDTTEVTMPTTPSGSGEVLQSVISNVKYPWGTPEWAKDLHQSATQLIGDFNDIRSEVMEQFEIMNKTMATIIGILVSGQVAVVVSLLIGSMIMIRGSVSLRETEDMIKKILKETEDMWPQIEKSLLCLMPAFNGVVDEEVLQRAEKIIKKINNI